MGAAMTAQAYTVSFHFKWNPGKLKEDLSYLFFFFFLLNKKHKLHTQLMQNLNKLKYAFCDPQKVLRVARGQSKVLRNIFKDDTSTLTAAMRNPQLSKTHWHYISSRSEHWETLQLLEHKFIAWEN